MTDQNYNVNYPKKRTLFHQISVRLYNILSLNKRKYNIQLGSCTAMPSIQPCRQGCLTCFNTNASHVRNWNILKIKENVCCLRYPKKLCFSYSYESIHTNTYLNTLYITYHRLHKYTSTYQLYKISMRNPHISFSQNCCEFR